MTTREIVTTFKEMYGADVSATLISKVTDAVIEQVVEWQSRPLDAIYSCYITLVSFLKLRTSSHICNNKP
jgi:transposase-like protein